MRTSLDQLLARWRRAPPQCREDRFDGRGIVICAGGERYFICAWVLISILRHTHRCSLPIQVWHLGNREMSEEMRMLLTEEGIEVINAEAIVARYPARLAGGWPLKPYAVAQSRFREVLYLDADTVPLVDPKTAFEWSDFRDNGLLMWPDIVDLKKSNPIWERMGLQPLDQTSVDSGIILVDKARAWDVLSLAVIMNESHEDFYDLLYGDKDTFLVAALYLGRRFGLIRHRPFEFGWDLVQRDPTGEPFVDHRTYSKWVLEQPNGPLSNPALMPQCEAALVDLRQRWSGIVFHAPERSRRAQAEEARLIAVRRFHYQSAPGDEREFELLPGGRIGMGAGLERNWAVTEHANTLLLKIYSGYSEYATLTQANDGSWRGTTGAAGSDIRLRELRPGSLEVENNGAHLSAENLVGALVNPTLFAAGYDRKRAAALGSALSLLNEMYDDVPEQIERHAAMHRPPTSWQGFLDRLAATLESARQKRSSLVGQRKMISRALKPTHYTRPA
jgi:hypothetical protein